MRGTIGPMPESCVDRLQKLGFSNIADYRATYKSHVWDFSAMDLERLESIAASWLYQQGYDVGVSAIS